MTERANKKEVNWVVCQQDLLVPLGLWADSKERAQQVFFYGTRVIVEGLELEEEEERESECCLLDSLASVHLQGTLAGVGG